MLDTSTIEPWVARRTISSPPAPRGGGRAPAVEVLQLLLEGEGVALVAAVAHDRQRPVLEQEGGDRGAEAARPPRHEDDAAGEGLAVEVIAVLGVAPGLLGVEVAGGHAHSGKRPRRLSLARPTREPTTRWAERSLSSGKLWATPTTFMPAPRAEAIPGTESSKARHSVGRRSGALSARPPAASREGAGAGLVR